MVHAILAIAAIPRYTGGAQPGRRHVCEVIIVAIGIHILRNGYIFGFFQALDPTVSRCGTTFWIGALEFFEAIVIPALVRSY